MVDKFSLVFLLFSFVATFLCVLPQLETSEEGSQSPSHLNSRRVVDSTNFRHNLRCFFFSFSSITPQHKMCCLSLNLRWFIFMFYHTSTADVLSIHQTSSITFDVFSNRPKTILNLNTLVLSVCFALSSLHFHYKTQLDLSLQLLYQFVHKVVFVH